MISILSKIYAILGKLGGKRFIVGLGALLAVSLHSWLGISEDTVNSYAGYAAAFMFGDQVLSWITGGATSSQAHASEE